MGKVDESYPPGEGWQGGAHLTIGFTGDLLKLAEMQGVGCRALGCKQETWVTSQLGPLFLCL